MNYFPISVNENEIALLFDKTNGSLKAVGPGDHKINPFFITPHVFSTTNQIAKSTSLSVSSSGPKEFKMIF